MKEWTAGPEGNTSILDHEDTAFKKKFKKNKNKKVPACKTLHASFTVTTNQFDAGQMGNVVYVDI